jgi:hypothetical protein
MRKNTGNDLIEQIQYFFQNLATAEQQPNKSVINKAGDICPACRVGRIDYDGTLNLVCERCGWRASGGGACT